MKPGMASILSELSSSGIYFDPCFKSQDLLDLGKALGTPKGDKRDPEVIRCIRPQTEAASKPNTLSSRYGLGAFPFHTDTAYWRVPARYVLLYCVNPGSGDRPTLFIDSHRWKLSDANRRDLCNEVWQTIYGKPFLCSIAESLSERFALRFDEACMRPLSQRAHLGAKIVQRAIANSKILSKIWKPGNLVIFDNFRYIHARGTSSLPDTDRIIQKVLVMR